MEVTKLISISKSNIIFAAYRNSHHKVQFVALTDFLIDYNDPRSLFWQILTCKDSGTPTSLRLIHILTRLFI
jgi:hypothetical protein